jgi:hypothetical protein
MFHLGHEPIAVQRHCDHVRPCPRLRLDWPATGSPATTRIVPLSNAAVGVTVARVAIVNITVPVIIRQALHDLDTIGNVLLNFII